MIIKYILLLIILNIFFKYSKSCTQDWECGNTPFTICKKNQTLPFHKIDINKNNKRLYFSIKYNDENEKRIVSIPITGSNNYNMISEATIYGQDTYQLLDGFNSLGPNGDFIIYGGRRIIGTQNYVFYKNNTIGQSISSVSDSNYIFDEINNIQYKCHPYSSRITKGSYYQENLNQILYYGCSEIKNINNNLYILYNNKIYLGSLNPLINEVSTITLPVVYTPSEFISSFEITPTHIYYLTGEYNSRNIYKVKLNNQSQKVLIYSDNNISSFKYFEDFIYFSSKDKIQRVNTITLQVETLFNFQTSSSNIGHCICAQGFISSSNSNEPKCSKYDSSKNIQSWVNGNVRCIPIDWKEPNNPIICNYDWQCKWGYSCKEKVFSGGTFSCSL